MTDLPADIQAFFESYRAAFDRLDGEAVARLYALPSGIASDLGYTHWPAFEPIRDNMVALCRQYRANGLASAAFRVSAFIAQGDRFAVADLAWHVTRSGSLAPWRFGTTYNLTRRDDGWRVLLCTAYSEQRLSGVAVEAEIADESRESA